MGDRATSRCESDHSKLPCDMNCKTGFMQENRGDSFLQQNEGVKSNPKGVQTISSSPSSNMDHSINTLRVLSDVTNQSTPKDQVKPSSSAGTKEEEKLSGTRNSVNLAQDVSSFSDEFPFITNCESEKNKYVLEIFQDQSVMKFFDDNSSDSNANGLRSLLNCREDQNNQKHNDGQNENAKPSELKEGNYKSGGHKLKRLKVSRDSSSKIFRTIDKAVISSNASGKPFNIYTDSVQESHHQPKKCNSGSDNLNQILDYLSSSDEKQTQASSIRKLADTNVTEIFREQSLLQTPKINSNPTKSVLVAFNEKEGSTLTTEDDTYHLAVQKLGCLSEHVPKVFRNKEKSNQLVHNSKGNMFNIYTDTRQDEEPNHCTIEGRAPSTAEMISTSETNSSKQNKGVSTSLPSPLSRTPLGCIQNASHESTKLSTSIQKSSKLKKSNAKISASKDHAKSSSSSNESDIAPVQKENVGC